MKDYEGRIMYSIVHCNRVSKPVKGKYLLLRMNSIMYLLLTWYTLIMFLKVLSHLILKIKSFMKYFKKGVLKFSWNFQIFQSEIFHRASLVGGQQARSRGVSAAAWRFSCMSYSRPPSLLAIDVVFLLFIPWYVCMAYRQSWANYLLTSNLVENYKWCNNAIELSIITNYFGFLGQITN